MGKSWTRIREKNRTGICIDLSVYFFYQAQILAVANAMTMLASDLALSRYEFVLFAHILTLLAIFPKRLS